MGDEVSTIRKLMPIIQAHLESEHEWRKMLEDKMIVHRDEILRLRNFKDETLRFVGKIAGVLAVGAVLLSLLITLLMRALGP